jgi:glutathione synthase/RimK-type ligase-like ATP-grasp enzyme
MRLAIHHRKGSFSDRWIEYCIRNNISYKIVNVYENDIIQNLSDCNAFLWHHSHSHSKDILFAKQLLFSLDQVGTLVFPNFNTAWHFDDKVGQKYLLESIDAPLVPSYVFYDKKNAKNWIDNTDFPKVFKLRGGAGSANVKLVNTKTEALKLLNKAFGKGFRQYEPWSNLQERWRKYRNGLTDFKDVLKGLLRFYKEPEFSKTIGYERGYIYFQNFIPNNDFDIRVIVIGNRAFAVKRMVRSNDFRASGSGQKKYERTEIDIRTVKIAFDISKKLKSNCIGCDFVFNQNSVPLLLEIG